MTSLRTLSTLSYASAFAADTCVRTMVIWSTTNCSASSTAARTGVSAVSFTLMISAFIRSIVSRGFTFSTNSSFVARTWVRILSGSGRIRAIASFIAVMTSTILASASSSASRICCRSARTSAMAASTSAITVLSVVLNSSTGGIA